MPRAAKGYIVVPKSPVENLYFKDGDTGASLHYKVYLEAGTQKELIECDFCHRYIPMRGKGSTRSPWLLFQHRGKNTCNKQRERLHRHQLEREEKALADAAFMSLYRPQADPSHAQKDLATSSLNEDSHTIGLHNDTAVTALAPKTSTVDYEGKVEKLPDSDEIEVMIAEDADKREQQKPGVSDVPASSTSSASRQPSPS